MDTNPMQTRWWVWRAFSRNPLVRASDRFEASMLAAVVAVVIFSVPFVLALATGVHDARTRALDTQTSTSHLVSATVVGQSVTAVRAYALDVTAKVTWRTGGTEHTAKVDVPKPMVAGDQVDIWVDNNGRLAQPPATEATATRDAVLAGVGAWVAVILCAAVLFLIIRAHLTRVRLAGWDLTIKHLVDDDGGRADWRG